MIVECDRIKSNFYNIFIAYSILFCVLFVFLYRSMFIENRIFVSYIDLPIDLKPIYWLARKLKSIISSLFLNQKFDFQLWEFSQYEGTDIMQGLFNAIGNPLFIIFAFISESSIPLVYNILVILLNYMAGIAFIILCKEFYINNPYAVLSGSMAYVFCTHSAFATFYHLSHLMPIVCLPFVLLGIERIIKNGNPIIYILSLFLLSSSSFYFFYMIAIMVIIYFLIRITYLSKDIHYILKYSLYMFVYSLISIFMSAIVLLPIIRHMMLDSRVSGKAPSIIFYPLIYYVDIFKNLLSYESTGHNLRFGYPAIFIITISNLVILSKKYKLYCMFFLVNIVLVIFPFFSKMFNGFQYATGRWCFELSLLSAMCISRVWDDIISYNIKNVKFSLIFAIIYTIILCYFVKIGTRPNLTYQLVLIYLSYIVILIPSKSVHKSQYLFAIVLVSIIINISYYSYPIGANQISATVSKDYFNKHFYENEAIYIQRYIDKVQDKDLFKYSGNFHVGVNSNFLVGIPSTDYYCSLTNPYVQDFTKKMSLNRATAQSWRDYDNSTILNELSSVKYFATNNNEVPYMYKKVAKIYNDSVETNNLEIKNKNIDSSHTCFTLYENNNFLQMAYGYDNVIKEEYLNTELPCDIQLNMLNNAIVSNYDGIMRYKKPIEQSVVLPTKIECKTKDVYMGKEYCVCYKNNQSISIKIDDAYDLNNKEVYLYITGLDYKSLSNYDFYYNKQLEFNDIVYDIDAENRFNVNLLTNSSIQNLKSEKLNNGFGKNSTNIYISGVNSKKLLRYHNSANPNYGDYHSFNINLGVTDKSIKTIELLFALPGIYTFDDIKIVFMPLDNYNDSVLNLKNNVAKNIKIEYDRILCDTDFDNNKFLCVATSYYPGWKAYIDGVETKIYPTNYMHIGFDVPAGKHKIELKYTNVFVIYGAIVSLIGLVLFIGAIVLYHKKHKEN